MGGIQIVAQRGKEHQEYYYSKNATQSTEIRSDGIC